MANSKYNFQWRTVDGVWHNIEDLETDHLMNIFKHLENKITIFRKWSVAYTGLPEKQVIREIVNSMRTIEDELLDRNVDYITIHNHIVDISYLEKYNESNL
jgi:hypothetical protein